LAAQAGWQLVRPDPAKLPPLWTDAGLEALSPAVPRQGRVFLIAEQDLAAAAFYAVSRTPDLWTAAVAVGGSPRAAIASNRLFGANTQLSPLLWLADAPDAAAWQARLAKTGFSVEVRTKAAMQEAIDWLAVRQRPPFPDSVDCETGNPRLARCFWIEMIAFDPKRRNDVLDSTRVRAGSGAFLNLGGFGFDATASGPGVAVAWLPEKYSGPLRLGDRIVSIAGKEIRDAPEYVSFMEQQVENKPVAIIVLRGKERKRLETGIVVPPREEVVTARVQGMFLPETREILLITRQVSALRVTIPEPWSGSAVSWNGQDIGKLATGCWNVEDAGARRCQ
jgi:hypothetical protein